MRHRSARIGLEGKRLRHPLRAEIADQRIVIACRGMGEAMKQPVHAFEYGARAEKTVASQQRRAQPGLRRPARMQPLGPGALGEVFDDAAGHRAGDAEGVHHLALLEPERRADAGRRAHGPEDRGRVKARLVHGLRHHHAEPADHLSADGDAQQRRAPIGIVALASRQHRRYDHRAGMHGPALERVVEILAVRGGAVDEGGSRRAHRACMSDGSASPLLVPARKRRLDVVLVARGETEPDDVDGQILALAAHGRGQPSRIERRDLARQNFGE
jgi:hypothetical protein